MHRVASMQTIECGSEIRAAVLQARRDGQVVGLVPTMGALHAGHLSLVDAACDRCDRVVVSVYVNPTQFGAGEDFDAYPRDLADDLTQLADRGVDWAYVPTTDSMYGDRHGTFVDVGRVALPWEGAARPTHFRGVATIVLKLFHRAPADIAFFGQKDYQQTVVLRRMIADLDVPIELRVEPTVREPDGLAMSSRNAYLSAADRQRAAAIYQSLLRAQQLHAAGQRNAEVLRCTIRDELNAAGNLDIEYVAVLADGGVDEIETVDRPAVVAVAVRIGNTRLIDNLPLQS